jgi:vacuolar-type H+-ATPase subunit H
MAKQDTETGLNQDEFSKIFDEYRAKIEEITRRTEKNLHTIDGEPEIKVSDKIERIEALAKVPLVEPPKNNGKDAKVVLLPTETGNNAEPVTSATILKIINGPPSAPPPPQAGEPVPAVGTPVNVVKNNPEPAASAAPTRTAPQPPPAPEPEAVPVSHRGNGGRPAIESYSEIIQDARREAKKIIEEAEESARKEAKKRTQSQVDKIVDKAKKEADDIIEKANKAADKVRDDVITESKREAEIIIRDITQKYRQETEEQSSRAMAEAQEKAQRLLADISESTSLVSQHITGIVARARKMIDELESGLQAETSELARIVSETQNRLTEVGAPVKRVERAAAAASAPAPARAATPAPAPPPPPTSEEPGFAPTLAVRLIGEKFPSSNGQGILFSGQMEMKSVSEDFDYQYLKKLKKYLVHIANIKYLQEYASEKEISVVFDILEPLPLLDILSNVPMVGEVITRADDDICLIFKNAG